MTHRADAPEPCQEHTEFIEKLGGPKKVADAINERLELNPPMTGQAVSNWKRRGIPYRFRGPLVVVAQEQNVAAPKDFFGISA